VIRPEPARWFEIVVAREDAFIALEALAAAGCVEIEWHGAQDAQTAAAMTELLKDFNALAQRYRPYWPAAATQLAAERRAPADAIAAALATLRAWAAAAEEPIAALQRCEARLAELALAEAALRELADSRIDFAALAKAENGVVASLFALPAGVEVEIPDDVLIRAADVPPLRRGSAQAERLLLAVGPPESIEAMARAVVEANGRRARFPDWLQPTAEANLARVAQLRAQEAATAARLRERIDALSAQYEVARALGDIARATWCFEHGGAIALGDPARGRIFARITGWTVDRARVIAAIEASGARAIVSFPAPPRGARPPLVLRNPWWARPFEVFIRLVGMPSATGTDPSMLLAFVVPLVFGYMFGDVGQGLVLIGVGWLLRNRLPVLRLLIPGGVAATAFGFVFGSVFCLEHVIEPLWLLPLEAPLPVLLVPIAGGAALLALGLLLGLVESFWQRQLAQWMREDLPVLIVYVGVLSGILHPAGWAFAVLGVAWSIAAAALHGRRIGPALAALGELVERTLQILINTLSFARVGAFALAHAGLASAVVALAEAAGNVVAQAIVLVLGNALILAIEGLVVSIQTTRLVLFEFFTRFFRAHGREFRPLAPPPVTIATH
jgi:V/A-type H+-transporting ATPase subunit I